MERKRMTYRGLALLLILLLAFTSLTIYAGAEEPSTTGPYSIEITKVSGQIPRSGSGMPPLPGAKFALYRVEDTWDYGNVLDDAELVATDTSDANGVCIFANLPLGRYVVIETEAPEGHILNPYPRDVNFREDTDNKVCTMLFYNEKEPTYSIDIYKYSGIIANSIPMSTFDLGHSYLSGAEFELWTAVDYEPGIKSNIPCVYDEDTGIYSFSELPEGEYFVRETKAPPGHKVTGEGLYFVSTGWLSSGETYPLCIGNEKLYSIEITKWEAPEPSKPPTTRLPGAEFELHLLDETWEDWEDWNVGNAWIDNSELIGNSVSGDDGVCRFTDLEWGRYVVVETRAPYGYALDSTPRLADLTDYENVSDYLLGLDAYNTPLPADYSVEITKLDDGEGADAKRLSGAVFELYWSPDVGAEPDDYDALKAGDYPLIATVTAADTEGVYTFAGLYAYRYFIVEKTPPNGYERDATPQLVDFINFDPTANPDDITYTISLTFINTKKAEPPTPPPTPKPTDNYEEQPEEEPPTTTPPVTAKPSTPIAPEETPPTTPEPTPEPTVPVETPTPTPIVKPKPKPPTTNELTSNEDGSFTELDENGVPRGTWRWDDELEMWVFDPIVPLSGGQLPKTGNTANAAVFLTLATLSLAVIAKLSIPTKRKD